MPFLRPLTTSMALLSCAAAQAQNASEAVECELCEETSPLSHADRANAASPFVLEDSIRPFVDAFNASAGKPRVVALVSSTCGICIDGAQAIRESILETFPDGDIAALIIWIPILQNDSTQKAMDASALFAGDERVQQFIDPNRLFGSIYSDQLLYPNAGVAWDMYMFYDADAIWDDAPPEPTDWVHQLSGGKRGDPERFLKGEALRERMNQTASELLGAKAKAPSGPTYEFLAFESCPNSPNMRTNLIEAIESMGGTIAWTEIDLESLDENDPRRRWGAPTILVNGEDLFGAPAGASALSCRIYPGGVPSGDAIALKIQMARRRP